MIVRVAGWELFLTPYQPNPNRQPDHLPFPSWSSISDSTHWSLHLLRLDLQSRTQLTQAFAFSNLGMFNLRPKKIYMWVDCLISDAKGSEEVAKRKIKKKSVKSPSHGRRSPETLLSSQRNTDDAGEDQWCGGERRRPLVVAKWREKMTLLAKNTPPRWRSMEALIYS